MKHLKNAICLEFNIFADEILINKITPLNMKKISLLLVVSIIYSLSIVANPPQKARMNKFVSNLMNKMTLEEKIGQLNFAAGGVPQVAGSALGQEQAIRNGLVGATGGFTPEGNYHAQKIAINESRLGIPLLFGLDVIHGYHTVFPIPLGSASSWNILLIEKSARIAANEATCFGINWTFSPMVDICRDARWGRIAEGAGEDPFLGSSIAQAMVRGYQGNDLGSDSTLASCVKHFALYGASEAGRDYNSVDMSRVNMYNYYLPPYKAAVDANVATLMSSFNVVDGIPATGNKWLLTDLLRNKWMYRGMVVSDANSIAEMKAHGLGDDMDVSCLALKAGTDMDLNAMEYILNIKKALFAGKVSMSDIDNSCRRILELKYKLGLFENPFKYWNTDRQRQVASSYNLSVAENLAEESIVLLKNSDNLLPLSKNRKIAVIGPLGSDGQLLRGTWVTTQNDKNATSVFDAIRNINKSTVQYARGSNVTEEYNIYPNSHPAPSDSLINEAVKTAKNADVIIATIGEPSDWSGEAHSRAYLELPKCQKQLLAALKTTGKPIVLVLFSGRPLIITDEEKQFSTIIEAWHGGTMAAPALANVLFGNVNPSAKITATFPKSMGQIPIYYNHLNTGRPYVPGNACVTLYIDESNDPLFPFGYGLSYTSFVYGDIVLNKTNLKGVNDRLIATIPVTNTGIYDGKEVIQLYINDPVARVSRPVIELKGFKKILLKKGETQNVEFEITPELLSYYDNDGKYDWDSGMFNLYIGPNSKDLKKVSFSWIK